MKTTQTRGEPPKTRSQAISRMCRQCIADDREPGTWRQQVALCTSFSCPLWTLRPLPSERGAPWPSGASDAVMRVSGLTPGQMARWRGDLRTPPCADDG